MSLCNTVFYTLQNSVDGEGLRRCDAYPRHKDVQPEVQVASDNLWARWRWYRRLITLSSSTAKGFRSSLMWTLMLAISAYSIGISSWSEQEIRWKTMSAAASPIQGQHRPAGGHEDHRPHRLPDHRQHLHPHKRGNAVEGHRWPGGRVQEKGREGMRPDRAAAPRLVIRGAAANPVQGLYLLCDCTMTVTFPLEVILGNDRICQIRYLSLLRQIGV